MKPTLLSTLSLSLTTLLSTGTLASDVGGNKNICVENKDTGICTFTVVSENEQKSGMEYEEKDFVYVLDNDCNSIIDSEDCNEDGLCLQDITNDDEITKDDASIIIGINGKEYVLNLGQRQARDLWKHPPLFEYTYADDGGDDYGDTNAPCTCAHDVRKGLYLDVQVCNCWFRC